MLSEVCMNKNGDDRVEQLKLAMSPARDDVLYLRIASSEKDFLRKVSKKFNVSMSQLVLDTVMQTWKNEPV